MKNKTLLAASLMFTAFINVAHATDDQGTVNFSGVIINPPCEINSNSKAVNVVFTPLGTNAFSAIGAEASQTQPFSINLTKCPADTKVNITFSGDTATDKTQLKALTSVADTGVGIVVYGTGSASSTKVTFDDQPNAAFQQTTGSETVNDITFNYSSKIVATVAPASIVGGDFTASSTFTVYYP